MKRSIAVCLGLLALAAPAAADSPVAVKSSVRPGSANVCLVVESGGRRCCSAAGDGVAAVPRHAPPFWPDGDGDGDGVAAGCCSEAGELASSARAPLTQHMINRVAARRMGRVAVKPKAMPFAPCARPRSSCAV